MKNLINEDLLLQEMNLEEMNSVSGGIVGWNWGYFVKGFVAGAGIGSAVYIASEMMSA